MDAAVDKALRGPLDLSPGVPRRVAAHTRIADAIRSGVLRPATMLPSEAELCELMGISRTVVREALIFLEEDGLIWSKRGIGRFVADRPPRVGLERAESPEVLFAADGDVRVERTVRRQQATSPAFFTDVLGLPEDLPSWFFESRILRGDDVIALVHEHLPAGEHLDRAGGEILGVLEGAPDSITVHEALKKQGILLGPGQTTLTVGTPGESRAALMDLAPSEPVIVLSRYLHRGDVPVYAAKILVNQHRTLLAVTHGAP